MMAAPARRRGRCANVPRMPTGALTGGGALGVPAALLILGGGDLGMRRTLGSRGGLPCPRRPRGSSGANGARRFDARQACERRRVETRRRAAEVGVREVLT